jgi:hypothetical protein
MNCRRRVACASGVLMLAASLAAQAPRSLVESGSVMVDGQSRPYIIRFLPPSSFPDLPPAIALQLTQRGCLIPQTYEARRPENVVRASLERAGSSDWAVLCSASETVTLLVFFESAPESPSVLATAAETDRLQQHVGSGTLGFNWGVDPATPRRVHDAQIGLRPRPTALEHDALADSVVDRRTAYRYFANGRWTLLDMPAD